MIHVRAHNPSRRGISLMEVRMAVFVVSIGLVGVAVMLPVAHEQALTGKIAERAGMVGRAAVRDFHVRGMGNSGNWLNSSGNAPNNWPDATKAYVLDPIYVAAKGNNGSLGLDRITLRRAPGDGNAMSAAMARHVFASRDDLEVIVPEDKDQLPEQVFYESGGNAAKRARRPDFTWMATIVPSPVGSQRFRVSIAVFYQRDLDDTGEKTVAATLTSGGLGGGEVTLDSDPGDGFAPVPGRWIMLKQTVNGVDDVRWYRVVAVANGGRRLTLDGPDWNTQGASSPTATAILLKDVRAVFETTVSPGTGSLW